MMLKHRDPLPCPIHIKAAVDDPLPPKDWSRLRSIGEALVLFGVCVIIGIALAGCASGDFQKLLEDVKANCHTTIDAQLATTISGIGGSGHFQQECWPTGAGPVPKTQ